MLLFRPLRTLNFRQVRPLFRNISTAGFPDINIDGPPYRPLTAGQKWHIDRNRSKLEINPPEPFDDGDIAKRVKKLARKTRKTRNIRVKKILPPPPGQHSYPKNERLYEGHAEFQAQIGNVLSAYKDHLRIGRYSDVDRKAGLFRDALLNRLTAFRTRVDAIGMDLEDEDVQKIIWRVYYDFVKLPLHQREVIALAMASKTSPEGITVTQEKAILKVTAEQGSWIRHGLGKAHPRVLSVNAELEFFHKFLKYFFERRNGIFGNNYDDWYTNVDDYGYASEIRSLWNYLPKIGKKHWAIQLDTSIEPEEILRHRLRGKRHLKLFM